MIIWKPNGSLDINTDPSDLPQSVDKNGNVTSDAVVRFKNLRIDKQGVTKTRDGSSKVNETSFSGTQELVTNGTFDNDISNWTDASTGNGSIAFNAGRIFLTSTSGNAVARQLITFTSIGFEHELTLDLESDAIVIGNQSTAVVITISIGLTAGSSEFLFRTISSSSSSLSLSGGASVENRLLFTPTSSSCYLTISRSAQTYGALIDNVSITNAISPVNLIVEQNGDRYEFAGERIFRNEEVINSSITNAQWSAIKYNSFNDDNESIFALNGVDRKRITGTVVAEWGIEPPNAPTLATGVLTGLTGTYNAKITFCRKVSDSIVSESDPSSAGTEKALTNQSLSVSWTPSTDSQVTHVRLYRTLRNGSVYYHDQDIPISSSSVDSNTADGSLGDRVEFNHDRPPLGTKVIGPAYDGTCFILKDNKLYYCLAKQPEYWPTDFFVEVGSLQSPQVTGIFHEGQLYTFSKDDGFYIQGTGSTTFFPIKLNLLTGAQGTFGALSIKGKGIFHTGPDGIYLFSGTDSKITSNNLNPIFRGEDTNGMPGVSDMSTAWLHQVSNRLYFGYTSSGFDFPTNVIVLNLDNGRISYFEYNDGNVIEMRCIVTDIENSRLLVGCTDGFVRVIEDTTSTTDSDEDISWECQTKDFILQTRAHFPRWNKYDIDASSATSCTATTILDDETFSEHSITGDRITKLRLLPTGNGRRQSTKLSGSGPISIYAVEGE